MNYNCWVVLQCHTSILSGQVKMPIRHGGADKWAAHPAAHLTGALLTNRPGLLLISLHLCSNQTHGAII